GNGCTLTDGTGWHCASDRGLKENVEPLDARDILQRVSAMPITHWNVKGFPAVRHIGPMAQDFHAAFGLSDDDRHIGTADAQGVALAAIQGLHQLMLEKDTQIVMLKAQAETQEHQMAQLRQELEMLLARTSAE